LAKSIQTSYQRIQFTPDLLPSDLIGSEVFNPQTREWELHEGPAFTNILLADEINRASPKTQSALLEVMEEGNVTIDGVSHSVGSPFMVIATQNPIEQAGTYRLPEAQLDRFLIKTSLGYPDHESTVRLLADASLRNRASIVQPLITNSGVTDMTTIADGVHVDPAVLSYVSRLAQEIRAMPTVKLGPSVRGCLAYVRVAKTWAAVHGRSYVLPDDVKDLAHPVLAHRIMLDPEAEFSGVTVASVIQNVLTEVRPPVDRVA